MQVWCEERRGIAKGQAVHYRSFLAASYSSFWKSYQQLAAHARHCYEVSSLSIMHCRRDESPLTLLATFEQTSPLS